MTSHPRQRPAATDYFNPAEQIELLNSIKAKVEQSTASTPQQQDDGTRTTPAHKPADFKAHELSLREKLERAKAEKEARAKVEASLRTNSTTAESPKPVVPPTEQTGPPPPPILNNVPTTTTPTPIPVTSYPQQPWPTNLGFPQHPSMTAYARPPYQYPPPYPYGIQPYTNGQPLPYAQWGYSAPIQTTPGVPPAPPQPNQGPTQQSPPNQISPGQIPTSASPPNHVPTPVNQGAHVTPDPRFQPGTIPPPLAQSTPAPISTPQVAQPPVNVPPIQQTTPTQQQPSTTPVAPPAPPVAPVQPMTTNNHGASAQPPPRSISPLTAAPKGPAGSIYNSAIPVPRGPARSNTQSDATGPHVNASKPSQQLSAPAAPRPTSPRGRVPSHREEARRYSTSPTNRRTSDQYLRDTYPSPRTQHPIPRYLEHPPRDAAPRTGFATRVTTPPARASYRDRSRSPHQRMGSVEYKSARPVIPEEGYKRDNWDPNRGGYKYSDFTAGTGDGRRYSPPSYFSQRSPPPPSHNRPPSQTRYAPRGRDMDERYLPPPLPPVEDRYPPPSRDYDDYYRRPPPPPPPPPSSIRQRSRSPPYHPHAYSPPPPPRAARDYPPRYYDYPAHPPPPVSRDPYAATYPRPHSPTPPGPVYRDRRLPYQDYYAAPVDTYPEGDYYGGVLPVPRPPSRPVADGYGYREREGLPPPRAYSPPRPPPQARGRGKRARGGRY